MLAVVLPPALWLLWLQRRRKARLSTASTKARPGTAAQVEHALAQADAPPIPRLRPLLRRVYAATKHAPKLAGTQLPIEDVQDQVLEQAQAILDCLHLQP